MATQRGRARSHSGEASNFPLATLPSLFDPLRRPCHPSQLVLNFNPFSAGPDFCKRLLSAKSTLCR